MVARSLSIVTLLVFFGGCGGDETGDEPQTRAPSYRDMGRSLVPDMGNLPIGSADSALPILDAGSTDISDGDIDPNDGSAAPAFDASVDMSTIEDVGLPLDAAVPVDAAPPPPNFDHVFPPADGDVLAQLELNGDLSDASGNDRDAVLIGGAFVNTGFGQGLEITEREHGIDWSQYAGRIRHPYTIEFVFTPTAESSTFAKLFSPDDDIEDGWYLYDGGFRAYPIEGGSLGSDFMPFGQRAYLTVVSTSDRQINVYANGLLISDEPINAQFTAPPDDAIFFRDDGSARRHEMMYGVVDAIRISSTARSADEIAAVQAELDAR